MHAEDGLLWFQWDDGERDVLTIRTARTRMNAIAEELAVWEAKKDNGGPGVDRAYAAEMYYNLRRSLANLAETLRDAEEQGDPENQEVRAKKLVAFLRSRRANLIGDTSRVDSPKAVGEAILMPLDYGRLPENLPKPKTGTLYFDNPAIPKR